MTREEVISLIKSAQLMLVNPKTNEPISDLYEALDIAVKALENKPRFILHSDGTIEQIIEPCGNLLDKIRAEIEQVAEEEREHDKRWAQGLKYALTIIDKQKIESEAAEQ